MQPRHAFGQHLFEAERMAAAWIRDLSDWHVSKRGEAAADCLRILVLSKSSGQLERIPSDHEPRGNVLHLSASAHDYFRDRCFQTSIMPSRNTLSAICAPSHALLFSQRTVCSALSPSFG